MGLCDSMELDIMELQSIIITGYYRIMRYYGIINGKGEGKVGKRVVRTNLKWEATMDSP